MAYLYERHQKSYQKLLHDMNHGIIDEKRQIIITQIINIKQKEYGEWLNTQLKRTLLQFQLGKHTIKQQK